MFLALHKYKHDLESYKFLSAELIQVVRLLLSVQTQIANYFQQGTHLVQKFLFYVFNFIIVGKNDIMYIPLNEPQIPFQQHHREDSSAVAVLSRPTVHP